MFAQKPPFNLSIPLGELDFLGLEWAGSYGCMILLSIPLGELDFLGHQLARGMEGDYQAFNSPWGIRFPWTRAAWLRLCQHEKAFNSPWGIRFPWT